MASEFTTRLAVRITGATQRQIIDWCERGFVVPLKDAAGYSSRRLLSVGNLFEIGLIKALSEWGVGRSYIRQIITAAKGFFCGHSLGGESLIEAVRAGSEDTLEAIADPVTRETARAIREELERRSESGGRPIDEILQDLIPPEFQPFAGKFGGDGGLDYLLVISDFSRVYFQIRGLRHTRKTYDYLLLDDVESGFHHSTPEEFGRYETQFRIDLGAIARRLEDAMQT